MIVGALMAVAVGSRLGGVPDPGRRACSILLALAALAGAVWSLPAAFLKVTRGVHEVISTIMFNWIALYLSGYLVFNVMNDPRSAERTRPGRARGTCAWAPWCRARTPRRRMFISVFVAVFFYWLLWHSPWGYEMRVAGFNHDALRYAGANPVVERQRHVFAGGPCLGHRGRDANYRATAHVRAVRRLVQSGQPRL